MGQQAKTFFQGLQLKFWGTLIYFSSDQEVTALASRLKGCGFESHLMLGGRGVKARPGWLLVSGAPPKSSNIV